MESLTIVSCFDFVLVTILRLFPPLFFFFCSNSFSSSSFSSSPSREILLLRRGKDRETITFLIKTSLRGFGKFPRRKRSVVVVVVRPEQNLDSRFIFPLTHSGAGEGEGGRDKAPALVLIYRGVDGLIWEVTRVECLIRRIEKSFRKKRINCRFENKTSSNRSSSVCRDNATN